jgi:hypothetical protein
MCTYIVIFIQFYDLVGTLFLQKGTAGENAQALGRGELDP